MKTRDKELAVQAGWIKEAGEPDAGCLNLEHFAELARADEREVCTKLCEGIVALNEYAYADECVTVLRARGNK